MVKTSKIAYGNLEMNNSVAQFNSSSK